MSIPFDITLLNFEAFGFVYLNTLRRKMLRVEWSGAESTMLEQIRLHLGEDTDAVLSCADVSTLAEAERAFVNRTRDGPGRVLSCSFEGPFDVAYNSSGLLYFEPATRKFANVNWSHDRTWRKQVCRVTGTEEGKALIKKLGRKRCREINAIMRERKRTREERFREVTEWLCEKNREELDDMEQQLNL